MCIPEMDVSINDFVINVATANGTGSQSSNLILLNSMFEMGVPVSGKNLFPSNMSGLPLGTSFVRRIRVPGAERQNRHTGSDECGYMVKDIEKVESGSIIIFNENVKLPVERDDCLVFGLPMTKLTGINPNGQDDCQYVLRRSHSAPYRNRSGRLEKAVNRQFKGKKSAVEVKLRAIEEGRMMAEQGITWDSPHALKPDRRKRVHSLSTGTRLPTWIDLRRGQHAILVPHYPLRPLQRHNSLAPQLRETGAGVYMPWSRPRTNWQQQAWFSEQAGLETGDDMLPLVQHH